MTEMSVVLPQPEGPTSMARAARDVAPLDPKGDTVWIGVVDARGNAVSLIQSLYYDFGSGVVAGDTGVLLQNRGTFFSLDPGHVNCLQPRKRTFHTLNPAMADGHDYVKTNKYVLFGHHFAAIAAAGPLIGPVLAAQFGYLPGALWILIGCVLAGCVHDTVVLFASVRHKGRSLAYIASREIGRTTGGVASVAVLFILILTLAGLSLAVVNAMVRCVPTLAPLLLLSPHKGLRAGLGLVGIFLGGRLVAYCTLGLLAGGVGRLGGAVPYSLLFLALTQVALGGMLIAQAFYNGAHKQCPGKRMLFGARKTIFTAGMVFAWTDEWYTGGHLIEDWKFGIVSDVRKPKPAYQAVADIYRQKLPMAQNGEFARLHAIQMGKARPEPQHPAPLVA